MNPSLAIRGAEVPFRYLSPTAPLIMVPVKINGHGPFDFILDTGNAAFPILISPELAARVGIRGRPSKIKDGFTVDLGGSFELGKVDTFELGDIKVSSMDIAISPALTELTKRLQIAVEGNIGYPFLKDYSLTFDFKRSVVTLSKDSPVGDSVPFLPGGKSELILVDVFVNDKKLKFVLDTGASTCCISNEAAASLGLKLGAGVALNRAAKVNSHLTKLDTLRVGRQSQSDVTVVAADFVSELTRAAGFHIDGVLGKNFWSHYRLTIDYPGKRLLLEKPQ